MAQFRILKGISTRLPMDKTEGNIYYTHDNSLFHIDFVNENGELVRKVLNADQATKDADGNDIIATYETKFEAERKLEQAKSYTDLALKDITTDFQTVSYEKMITVNSENQTTFEVPIETFDPVNDTLDVHQGRLYLTEGEDYTVSGHSIILKEAPEVNDTITFTVLKNVPALDGEITITPSMLEDGSIPLSKLEEMPVTATPDWNQNDANADDYIIGRTHYVEVVEGNEVVHKLDEKYLPDGLLTQSNLASDSEALEDIAELGLLEVMHHDGTVYYDATGKILSY